MKWLILISGLFLTFTLSVPAHAQQKDQDQISNIDITGAEKLIGLEFSKAQQDSMQKDLEENLESYQTLRKIPLNNSIPPALIFNPIPVGFRIPDEQFPIHWGVSDTFPLPQMTEELAFYPIKDLAELIRSRKITSTELTKMYLARLKKYGPQLECVITLTEDLALKQAAKADEEIAAGRYRGLLHGIPYGAKDLLAVKGYKTTWGAMPYKEQYIDENAAVIQKLEEAGAVLVAKLTLGALAWGDVWYGGKTRNPWNLEQGSSGSSAGSAAATAAGLVAFSIGTETWGSIVSPSTRCGDTGLRPTYGRVSRAGAMALSWSMDKIGPICRTVEDCAIVFNVIRGSDGMDQSVIDAPFNFTTDADLQKLKIGYLKSAFEQDTLNRENNQATLAKLTEMGVNLIPIELPDIPVNSLSFILSAEAASAFDELTRSGRDSLLVRQNRNAWPNVFRASRFIPAVEYIQANRFRHVLIQKMHELMQQVDLYLAPSFDDNLLLTNLTGNPCVVLPNGFNKDGTPTSISFIGKLFDEATILSVAKRYQDATGFQLKHPPLFHQF
jgi:Asp-tRNA(Asn)/Glu-tRNA(Gln) amidotransferase A subunit family amidase